jgi:argonaute-like protein implicated in RNA metabolism and viral defense
MNSTSSEVRQLLSSLAKKVQSNTEALNSQQIGNAFYGLQHMNSNCNETQELISALTPKLLDIREELNAQSIGNLLYGLQSMNSGVLPVRYSVRPATIIRL